jgi:hypothetical protein
MALPSHYDRRLEEIADTAMRLMFERRAKVFLEEAIGNYIAAFGATAAKIRLQEYFTHLEEFG